MDAHWQGSFITDPAPHDTGGAASYFRHEFHVGDGLLSASIAVTALGIVEAHLNGDRVGEAVLEPGWTSYRHRLGVRTHDVTALLRDGVNVVTAVVGDGWAVGRLGWEGGDRFWTDRPALNLQITLTYTDRTEVVASGPDFRVGTGAVTCNGLYDGETHDARLEPVGWDTAGFDDSGWRRAALVEWPLDTLTGDAGPQITRHEELAPVAVERTSDGRTIVDFGQNFTGWVKIRARGTAGQVITLRHAEVLTPAGRLEPATNRTAAATDRYVLAGGDEETWEPRFTFHGFRYVEIDGWDGPVDPDAVRGVVVHSAMERTGWLKTSDLLLDRLHDNAVWSMRGNFVGVPTDCPQRDERLGWTGDLNAFAPTAGLLFDARGVLDSWLADLRAEQQEKGYVPWAVPDVLPTPSAPTAIWSDVVVSLPWAMYQEYGDDSVLRDNADAMAAYIRQVAAQLDTDDLWSSGFQFGDWLDPDAPYDEPSNGKTDRHLVANAFLCRTTREMAATAALLGRDDADEFGALAERVRTAFCREYLTPSGRIVNETVTAYALVICFDLLTAEQLVTAGKRLAQLVATAKFRISTGFAGTPYVTEALERTGYLEEAYLLLTERQSPSFLYPVTMGATTVWERWDSILPDGTLNESGMTSLNHYALGAVVAWMYRALGGLQRLEPGYRRVRIEPKPGGGVKSAHMVHDTVRGRIEVRWEISDGTGTVSVSVPDGVDAEVVLPCHPDGQRETVTGEHSWTYPVPDDGHAAFDLDTAIGELAGDRTLWYRVTAVLEQHFPGMALDPAAPEVSAMSLSTLLQYIPTVPDTVTDDLRTALDAD